MPRSLVPWTLPADPTTSFQSSTKQYVDRLTARYSVKEYGAAGDGATDDIGAINSAIAACPPGGIVFFPPGIYAISAPIVVPPQITMESSHTDIIQYSGAAAIPTAIMPTATFSGNGVIKLMGKADGGYSVDHVGAVVRYLTIDGTNLPTGSATRGIRVEGFVREFFFEHVTVRHVNDTGFWFGAGTTSGLFPASFRMFHCLADTCGNNGYTFSNTPDSTIFDCNALGNTHVGFYVAGFMNGQISNCRSEWSGYQGYYFTSGYWGTGQGSGGCNVLNCSTDRSNQDGILIDATGSGALIFTNCLNRRDGRNNGTGGNSYSGFRVTSATLPVSVTNHSVYPGVDDNGTGTLSPQYGVTASGATMVTVSTGYVHAATTAINDGGGNTAFLTDAAVGTAVGATATPTRTAPVGDVPLTQRGPIGGVSTAVYAATVTPNASASTYFRYTGISAAMAVNLPTGGQDGEQILFELITTAAVTITFNASYEIGQNVTSRALTVASGKAAFVRAVLRSGGVWRLLAMDTG